MGHIISTIFFFPGEVVCNALGATAGDDRMMIRTLVNMLVWNLVMVLGIFVVY